jgi:diguanylate cyclase (GGDEF)-like protein
MMRFIPRHLRAPWHAIRMGLEWLKSYLDMQHREIDRLRRECTDWKQQAEIEPCTGLYRREVFYQLGEQRFSAGEYPISAIVIDLDYFKSVNDQYGHAAGDGVIAEVGKIILGNIREGDIAGRNVHGDEFLILVRANLDDAVAIAHRIRDELKSLKFRSSFGISTENHGTNNNPKGGRTFRVSLTFGVAERGPDVESLADLIIRADFAMKEQKDSRGIRSR